MYCTKMRVEKKTCRDSVCIPKISAEIKCVFDSALFRGNMAIDHTYKSATASKTKRAAEAAENRKMWREKKTSAENTREGFLRSLVVKNTSLDDGSLYQTTPWAELFLATEKQRVLAVFWSSIKVEIIRELSVLGFNE